MELTTLDPGRPGDSGGLAAQGSHRVGAQGECAAIDLVRGPRGSVEGQALQVTGTVHKWSGSGSDRHWGPAEWPSLRVDRRL